MRIMGRLETVAWVGCAAVLMACAACTTTHRLEPVSQDWLESPDWANRLQPGDVLSIKFPYTPELNEEQAIRPDGKIALQLVGEVLAAGRSPDELREELLQEYSSSLRDPELTVIVSRFASHFAYVGGEVTQPGMVEIPNARLSVIDAIIRAGGFRNISAAPSRVVIVRQRDGVQYARTIDVKSGLKSPETEPFYLQPYDIVYVPRTRIERFNQWVDQHLYNLVPDNVLLTFDKDIDGGGTGGGAELTGALGPLTISTTP